MTYLALHRPPTAGPLDLPDPPATLTPDTYAARLYDMLEPLAQLDPTVGWSLLILCNAVGVPYQLVEDWVRDTDAGPGWSLMLDVDRCPSEALPWLAQFVGVRLVPGASDADNRARIASTDGFRRGTVAAMKAAATATLTGAQVLDFRERSGDPVAEPIAYAYRLTVRTYADQTPDATATLAALMAQKPGGIVLDYATVTGQTWAQVKAGFATWQAVKSGYPDWLAVKTDEP
jgi:tail protein P2 I